MGEAEQRRALSILYYMALERKGWWRFFSRWWISDEPLRNDAAELLRDIGYQPEPPYGATILRGPGA